MGYDVSTGATGVYEIQDPESVLIMGQARVLRLEGQLPLIEGRPAKDVPCVLVEFEYEASDKAKGRRVARVLVATDTAAELGSALMLVAEQVGITPEDLV